MLVSRVVIAVFAACMIGCSADGAAEGCATRDSLQDVGDGGKSFCIVLESGLEVHNVVFRRESIGGDWILQFRRLNGLDVRRTAADGVDSSIDQLSVDEFSSLLNTALGLVQSEFGGAAPDSIQTDLVLVDEAWHDVVAAIRTQAAQLSGSVVPKVKEIDNAALEAILTSRLVTQMCQVVGEFDQVCADHISLNPIAFDANAIGSSWDELENVPDYGLSDATWFGLPLDRR